MISVLGKGYEILYNFFCDNLILGVLKTELFLCLDGTQTKGTNSSRDQSSQHFRKQSATPSKIVRSKGLTLSECCLEMRIFMIWMNLNTLTLGKSALRQQSKTSCVLKIGRKEPIFSEKSVGFPTFQTSFFFLEVHYSVYNL